MRSHRFLSIFLLAASLWYIAFFLFVACLRASFPMQLEWVESGVLDAVVRVLAHQPVYVAPTHLFVPYLYTPLYYYVAAIACRVGGLGFEPLRWLSTTCTLGCFVLIFLQTRALTASRYAGLLAAGCFAALYGASGGCYDLARVDMLFVVLALAAIYALWHDQALLAGLLFACAYQSKQGAAIIAVCVLLGSWRRPRQCATGMVTFLVATAGSVLILNHVSGGWYVFYTQWLPRHQPLAPQSLFSLFARDLGRYLLPGLLLVAWNLRRDPARFWSSRRGNFLLAGTLGTSLTAFAGRLHSGGGANSTVPFFAWFAILFAIAIHRMVAPLVTPSRGSRFAAGLAVLQFLILFTLPSHFVPSHRERQQAQQFLAQIAMVPGDIYVIDAAADLAPLHKTSFANGVPVSDVIRAGDSPAARAMVADIQQALRQRRYAALLAPNPLDGSNTFAGEPPNLSLYYRLDTPPLRTGEAARALKILQTPGIGPDYLFPARP